MFGLNNHPEMPNMPAQKHLDTEAIDVIDKLGGNAKTAEICDVSPAAVSQWRHNGIPKAQRKFLLLAYPHVFAGQPHTVAAR